jgi:hypothetical protein
MSQEETSCHKKKITFKWRNFLWQEETSHHSMKPPIRGRNFCHTRKHLKMDEHKAEEEIEIAENVPVLQNA